MSKRERRESFIVGVVIVVAMLVLLCVAMFVKVPT